MHCEMMLPKGYNALSLAIYFRMVAMTWVCWYTVNLCVSVKHTLHQHAVWSWCSVQGMGVCVLSIHLYIACSVTILIIIHQLDS